MHVQDFNLTQRLQETLVSFDPECREYAFLRTTPIAIYVDAGDYDEELSSKIASIVDDVMKEEGFEAPEQLGRFYGSLILLNLSRAPEPLDEPTFKERLGRVMNGIVDGLRKLPWGDATEATGSTIEAVVAIGTFVLIVAAAPAVPLVIGSFVVPAKVWMIISAAGEGVKVIKETKNIFLHSKAAVQARGDADRANASPSGPTSKENSVEKWESVQVTAARMKELEEEVRHLRESLRNLQKRPSTA